MTAIHIRPYRQQDKKATLRLLAQLNHFEARLCDDRRDDIAAASDCLEENLADLAVFVAETEGQVVGYLTFCAEDGPAFLKPELRRQGWVMDLVVDESMRGQGLGRKLLEFAEHHARREGCASLHIIALHSNESAIAAYETFGFRRYSMELEKRL